MKKIVILGSDSYIATKLINSRYKDNLKLFSIKSSNKKNEHVIDDLFKLETSDFDKADVVINFTAIVHRPDLKDYSLYEKINTNLPIHLAQITKLAGVKHFIQMSSIAVYGNNSNISINSIEQAETIYGQTKLNADKKLLSIQDKTFKVSIIRPPMVYGGGKSPGNLLKLVKYSVRGFPMPFKGIQNKRDFIHVNNLIQALNIIIDKKILGIIIPTDQNPVSTETIIKLIRKYSPNKVRLINVPSFFLKIIKAINPTVYNKVFGDLLVECSLPEHIYKPQFKIEDGIKEIIESLQL